MNYVQSQRMDDNCVKTWYRWQKLSENDSVDSKEWGRNSIKSMWESVKVLLLSKLPKSWLNNLQKITWKRFSWLRKIAAKFCQIYVREWKVLRRWNCQKPELWSLQKVTWKWFSSLRTSSVLTKECFMAWRDKIGLLDLLDL